MTNPQLLIDKQLLIDLRQYVDECEGYKADDLAARLDAALAQPAAQGEAVAWITPQKLAAIRGNDPGDSCGVEVICAAENRGNYSIPIYTHPSQQPTPQQISDYLNGLDRIEREAAAYAARKAESKQPQQQARGTVTKNLIRTACAAYNLDPNLVLPVSEDAMLRALEAVADQLAGGGK